MKKCIIVCLFIFIYIAAVGCAQNAQPEDPNTTFTTESNSLDLSTQTAKLPLPSPVTESSPSPSENVAINSEEEKMVQDGRRITIICDSGMSCTLELGMTLGEAEHLFEEAGATIKHRQSNEKYTSFAFFFTDEFIHHSEISLTQGVGHLSAYREVDSDEWLVYYISISTPLIATDKGLRIGDLEARIEELYGEYQHFENDSAESHRYYTYKFDGYSLLIGAGDWMTDEQYVFDWAIYMDIPSEE